MSRFFLRFICLLVIISFIGALPMNAFATLPVIPDGQLPSGLSYTALEQVIDNFVDNHKETTAGMSVIVFDGQEMLLEKSYGYADVENEFANDADTVFEWGSITKLLVWVSVMQLVEQGKLVLDEDIHTYLPSGFFKKLNYDDPITMLHLMNHTGGWQEVLVGSSLTDSSQIKSLKDALKALEPTQIFRPGEHTAYSNYSTALAGYIVELISGVAFYEYVHNNIFTPLGMTHTALKPDLSDNVWVKNQREKLSCYSVNMDDLGTSCYFDLLYPAGKATGTISDLYSFASALLVDENGSSPLFDKPETLVELYEPTSYFPDGKIPENCHGFWAETQMLGGVIGHSGNTPGCSAQLLIDPANEVGMVIMTNQVYESTYTDTMPLRIFGEKSHSASKELMDTAIVKGAYYNTRTILKGILKPFSLTRLLLVSEDTYGSLSIPVGNNKIKCISPGCYKLSWEGGYMLAYADIDENGMVQALSISGDKYIRTSWGTFFFHIFALLAFLIAGLYGIIMLFIMFVCRIFGHTQPLSGLRAITCGSVSAVLINFIFMLNNQISLVRLYIHGILFLLLALVPVIYSVVLVMQIKILDATKKQKRGLIVTANMGLLMVFSVIYWQLWMFWV